MPPPSRTRCILKWTGTGLSALIVATWIASYWFEFTTALTNHTIAWIYSGSTRVIVAEFDVKSEWDLSTGVRRRSNVESGFRRPELRYRCQVTLHRYIPLEDVGEDPPPPVEGIYSRGLLPLWIPFLILALPTAWLWHRDRRRIRPGCCLRCGYDLTGNRSGVCSECGEKTTIVADAPSRQGRG